MNSLSHDDKHPFEYPLIFLVFMNYLFGIRLHYEPPNCCQITSPIPASPDSLEDDWETESEKERKKQEQQNVVFKGKQI